MNRELRLALTAVQYFTRLPVPAAIGHSAEQLDGATRYFPLVGLGVGAIGAAVLWLAARWLPVSVAVMLSMLATVLVTGAFHEDGLADSADGLFGGWSVEDRLRIMKDSRSGVFGVLALLLILSLKWSALSALTIDVAVAALMLSHVVSRCCAVWIMRLLPYVREDEGSRAKPIAKNISVPNLLVTNGTVLVVAMLCAWWLRNAITVGAAVAAAIAMTAWMRRLLRLALGGYTGDGLGATQQITEVSSYIAVLAALHA
jgi:adenosylcobinamide-GDP ribazoletransferase